MSSKWTNKRIVEEIKKMQPNESDANVILANVILKMRKDYEQQLLEVERELHRYINLVGEL
jgi:hypothetical protein